MKLMIWSLLPFSLLCMHTDRQEQMWVPALYLSFCPQRKKESNDRISTRLSRAYWPPLLSCYHYYTTTLDSTLTLIVSDMKREELYELLFYYMHSLTSLFAKKRKSNWFFTSSFWWSDASIKSFFLVHFNDIKSGKRMLKKILIIPKKWKISEN